MSRRSLSSSSGTTLVEAIIFGAIASLVVVGVIGLLSRGSKIIELGRRTSSSATDLKLVLETMAEDIAELVHVDDLGKAYDSAQPSTKLSFVVRSSRKEKGVPDAPAGSTGLRRITYRLEGDKELKDVMRSVLVLDGAEQPVGNASERALVRRGMSKLRAWPIAAVPRPGKPYGLLMASDTNVAHKKGATMACVLVEVSIGENSGEISIEKQTRSKIVTKLWCRNRVLELSRGSLR